MLGNVIGLTGHRRGESQEFGVKNAILPTGIGHIELLQPTDPTKAIGRFLEKHGEGEIGRASCRERV